MTIATFPQPYHDEILYSVVARYAERMRYPASHMVMEELFGGRIRAVVDLPSRLQHLADSLSSNYEITVHDLIYGHTMYPLFIPFLPHERLQKLEAGLIGNQKGMNLLAGGAGNGIPSHAHLPFCPLCAEEDQQIHGEAYWHRTHLIYGVPLCVKHGIRLSYSTIPTTNSREFVPADWIIESSEMDLSPLHDNDGILLAIGRSANWILSQKNLSGEFSNLRSCYIHFLVKMGLATHSGSIRIKELDAAVRDQYSHEFLSSIGCELDGRHRRNWLATIAQSSNSHHPIRHLLLMHFIGVSAEEFFNSPTELTPFDQGPYPCLNKVCPQYIKPIIESVEVGYSRRSQRRPSGTFVCPICGYTYRRVGPDENPEDLYRGKVLDYGHLWRDTLRFPMERSQSESKTESFTTWRRAGHFTKSSAKARLNR